MKPPGTEQDRLVRAAIAQWRDELVNLTARNRLLNFKASRTGSVELARLRMETVLQALMDEQVFTFRSLAREESSLPAGETARIPDPTPRRSSDGGQVNLPPARDDVLDTHASVADLSAALRSLMRKANQEYMDRGVWVLYLAFGMLAWTEQDGAAYRSPLLLVPVQLRSRGPRTLPDLCAVDEDPTINPALALKLDQAGIALPAVDELEGADLSTIFDAVRAAVSENPGWRVEEVLHLSYFSFAKEAMYRDLLDNEDVIASHHGVGALSAGGRHDGGAHDFLFDEIPDERIDVDAPADTTPLVLDADSSQRACIAAALEGRSFVMDGPPGTGKSQTIANMIGALLHAGRSVLFVSEKAAALEVVKNRLTDVGLSAYLLELHSHKATRKEVASTLGQALDTICVAPSPLPMKDRLQSRRLQQELNAYAEAINVVRSPLSLSLHQAFGRLAQLHEVPAAPAAPRDIQSLSVEAFGAVLDTAHMLSRCWRPALEGNSYVWRGLVATSSLDAVLYRAATSLDRLREITAFYSEVTAAFSLHRPSQAVVLAEILTLWAERPDPPPPPAWLSNDSLRDVRAAVDTLSIRLRELAERDAEADRQSGGPWRSLPAGMSLTWPLNAQVADNAPEAVDVEHLTATQSAELAASFAVQADMLEARARSLGEISAMLGLPTARTLDQAGYVLAVAALGGLGNRPEAAWFARTGFDAALTACDALRSALAALDGAQKAAQAVFLDGVLRLEITDLAARFETEHHGWRKWRRSYRADRDAVVTVTRAGTPASVAQASLGLVLSWKRSQIRLAAAEAAHAWALGSYYDGAATNFSLITQVLAQLKPLLHLQVDLSTAATSLSCGSAPPRALSANAAETRRDLDRWRSSLVAAGQAGSASHVAAMTFTDAVIWLRAQVAPANTASVFTRAVSQSAGKDLTTSAARHLMDGRRRIEVIHETFAATTGSCATPLNGLYQGEQTQMDAVRAAVDWSERLRSGSGEDRALSTGQIAALDHAKYSDRLNHAVTAWEESRNGVLAAFGPERRRGLSADLDDYEEAAEVIEAFTADPGGRDEWFGYQKGRADLATHGLDVTVDFCTDQRIPAHQIPDVLERAVLQQWADHYLRHDPALSTARSEDRDVLVEAYGTLDRNLIATSVSDIITACNARRPRSEAGQSAIIRREAEKKKKHMPVRLLIDKTRQVTQAIKPCFMMSPLSVSQYLPPDLRFDVVIFDEASQVSPSDAINCIYRGEALITAGDQKQLPPTKFFASSSDDDGEEWSEEAEDVKDFESILDLAKGSGAYRSLTLRWHYRSRHEALISFSNASFYGGRLVTFPGVEEAGHDVGVQMFRVDGVYRRGSSRDNPIEAEFVARRVMNHYSNRPNLSLGVVTFSEAQAATIEDAVERARTERPDLERFFVDDRLGGFFVKNLESVQGDERDVMIFSIGYGPDENRKLTMNFGPLNRSGGWRRLNVAITRARYRNEIVSSVVAGDISTGTGGEGLRHFRRYLDFAERGNAALALDTSFGGDAESPFEESVLSVVRSWGYDATPQVGAAGYRIDMGIRHPDHPEVFALGIECDGFQYHSAKVARDRDRLREQVLHGLGWHLHRIWSTGWNRNRAGEEDRLQAAIDAAIAAPIRGLLSDVPSSQPFRNQVVLSQPAEPSTAPDWVVPYRTAGVDPLPQWIDPGEPAARSHVLAAVETIAAVEGPVHLSVVYQRLREAWNVGRVSSRLKRNIDIAIEASTALQQDGEFIIVAGAPVINARTPVPPFARKIDQIHDDELACAAINLVRDAGGISAAELSLHLARLFGWNRRGADIARTP